MRGWVSDAPAEGVRGDDRASLCEVLHAEVRQQEPVEWLLSGRTADHLARVDRGDLHLTALAGRRLLQRNEHVHRAKRDVRDSGRAARTARELDVVRPELLLDSSTFLSAVVGSRSRPVAGRARVQPSGLVTSLVTG